jgi:trans-2,3-dihydro-3-hydroxyanthranilate isomerase
MAPLPFHLVDVFASGPLEGNPLAVVTGADALDDATMKRIAREFNQSETTFVLRPSRAEADWRLRSFTAPGHEVFGAGHNALGAWWLLASLGVVECASASVVVRQEIGPHVLDVELRCERGEVRRIAMTHAPAAFGAQVTDLLSLAEALGLAARDLEGTGLPVQVVSTGAAHCLVPARDRAAVDRARPDAVRLREILGRAAGEGCYLFALDPVDPSSTAYARFFNPTAGIVEDPATGTAAGPLAAQLVACRRVEPETTVTVEQGFAMGRPSRLEVQVRGDEIRLLGRAVVVASGTLLI